MRVALVGNQNSGKTTLFNLLTGTNQKIGNWPGVTIEKKSGFLRGSDIEVVDLPGIYALSPYTMEEKIARDYLLEEQIDLVVNVIDSTSMERSFYLTTQILELDIPVLMALNMADLAVTNGISIDLKTLEERFDTTIVSVSALKKTGVFELIQIIKNGHIRKNNYDHIYDHVIEKGLSEIEASMVLIHQRFFAVKLLEKDPVASAYATPEHHAIIERVQSSYNRDMEQVIADERYRHIEMIRDEAIKVTRTAPSATDRLDRIFLNKYAAIPIFVVIMFAIYYLAAGAVGSWSVEVVGTMIDHFGEWTTTTLLGLGASAWSVSLVVDGIIAGVGAILSFVPQLMILFTLIALLETSGYMARISFFLDRLFRKIGLSGKSLIPFIIGSGCSVPAIMSARTIKDEGEKKMTIMLTPFIPCSAKLPIITLFAGYFFTGHAGLASASLYFLAIVIIVFSALLMNRFYFRSKPSSYISELPSYKVPNLRYVTYDVGGKTIAFIKNAGSIIVLASVVLWFLISFSWRFAYGVPADQSMLAGLGNLFAWIFYPMTGEMNWGVAVSAIQGLIAKEQVVSSMAIISGFSEEVSTGLLIFESSMFAFFTPASAYAFMAFNLFSAPCFGSIAAMRSELGSTRQMLGAVLFQTGLAWVVAVIIFQAGRLIEVIL